MLSVAGWLVLMIVVASSGSVDGVLWGSVWVLRWGFYVTGVDVRQE